MAGKGPVESSSSSLPSNNMTKKIIRFQGHDMRFFELEEEMAMGKLKTYFSQEGTDSNDADDDAVVPLPFDSEVIYQILEYCKEPSAATPSRYLKMKDRCNIIYLVNTAMYLEIKDLEQLLTQIVEDKITEFSSEDNTLSPSQAQRVRDFFGGFD